MKQTDIEMERVCHRCRQRQTESDRDSDGQTGGESERQSKRKKKKEIDGDRCRLSKITHQNHRYKTNETRGTHYRGDEI